MDDGGETAKMAYNLRQAVRGHVGEIWCTETPLWSPSLKVAGAVDCVALWDGVPTICDWKTSRRPKRDEWVGDYRLQVTAYGAFHDELFGTRIENYAIVMTCETGDVQVFTGRIADHREELNRRIAQYYATNSDTHGERKAA